MGTLMGGRGGTRAMAADERNAARTTTLMTAADFPGQFLSKVNDADLTTLYNSLMRGVAAGDRTCIRAYMEALQIVGAQRDMVIVFLNQYGLRSADQLQQVVQQVRATEGLDEHSAYRSCLDYVRDYRERHGMPALIDPAREARSDTDATPSTNGT